MHIRKRKIVLLVVIVFLVGCSSSPDIGGVVESTSAPVDVSATSVTQESGEENQTSSDAPDESEQEPVDPVQALKDYYGVTDDEFDDSASWKSEGDTSGIPYPLTGTVTGIHHPEDPSIDYLSVYKYHEENGNLIFSQPSWIGDLSEGTKVQVFLITQQNTTALCFISGTMLQGWEAQGWASCARIKFDDWGSSE